MNRKVIVTNNFKGYHRYSEAPIDVAFLRDWHRHVFNIKTTIEVTHNERDIEFFQLQNFIEQFVKNAYTRTDIKYIEGICIHSCEALAEAILNKLHEVFPGRRARVEVWEDNENGAIVED